MDSGVRRLAMKALRWSLGLLLLVPAVSMPARAQQAAAPSSAASPADAKSDQDAKPKKARVWDNDNIPKSGDEISVVGPAQPASGASADANAAANGANGNAAAPAAGAAPAPASNGDGKRKTDKDARIEAAKQKLDNLKKDMELAQRKYNLDSDTYYGKPDYATDREGAEQLKTEKDALAAKQDEVDAAQKELDQLQVEAGDSSK
jgi:hypothetical protein